MTDIWRAQVSRKWTSDVFCFKAQTTQRKLFFLITQDISTPNKKHCDNVKQELYNLT